MLKSKRDSTRVALGDVVRLGRERTSDPDAEGFIRYVGLEHLNPGDLRIRRWGDVADGTTFTNVFRPGQVLFGKRRAYLRKVALADFEGVCSSDIYVLESKDPSVLLPELLPFICQTEDFLEHAVETSAGSLSPRTSWQRLAAHQIFLPSLDSQRRASEALWASQRSVESLAAVYRAAEACRAAFIDHTLEWFAQVWPTRTLTECLHRRTVGIVVKPASLYVKAEGEGVPALRSLNVQPGRLIWDDIVRISREGHAVHDKSSLRPGDVVVVRTGRPGDAAVIPEGVAQLNCIDLIVATPQESLRPAFLAAVLNSRYGRLQFLAGAAGTAQKHFNVGSLERLRVPLPPVPEQEAFEGSIARFAVTADSCRIRLKQAEALHRSLVNGALV